MSADVYRLVDLLVIDLLSGANGEERLARFALPRLLERYSPLKNGIVLA